MKNSWIVHQRKNLWLTKGFRNFLGNVNESLAQIVPNNTTVTKFAPKLGLVNEEMEISPKAYVRPRHVVKID